MPEKESDRRFCRTNSSSKASLSASDSSFASDGLGDQRLLSSTRANSDKSKIYDFWLKFFDTAGLPDAQCVAYTKIFVENRIQKQLLGDLTKEYLRDMGISAIGDIMSILKTASKLHSMVGTKRNVSSSVPVLSSHSPTAGHFDNSDFFHTGRQRSEIKAEKWAENADTTDSDVEESGLREKTGCSASNGISFDSSCLKSDKRNGRHDSQSHYAQKADDRAGRRSPLDDRKVLSNRRHKAEATALPSSAAQHVVMRSAPSDRARDEGQETLLALSAPSEAVQLSAEEHMPTKRTRCDALIRAEMPREKDVRSRLGDPQKDDILAAEADSPLKQRVVPCKSVSPVKECNKGGVGGHQHVSSRLGPRNHRICHADDKSRAHHNGSQADLRSGGNGCVDLADTLASRRHIARREGIHRGAEERNPRLATKPRVKTAHHGDRSGLPQDAHRKSPLASRLGSREGRF